MFYVAAVIIDFSGVIGICQKNAVVSKIMVNFIFFLAPIFRGN